MVHRDRRESPTAPTCSPAWRRSPRSPATTRSTSWSRSSRWRRTWTSATADERGYVIKGKTMKPSRYGPFKYVPITKRPKLEWPDGKRLAFWINPNVEFFGLDDVMPGVVNERVAREHAKVPNVRNWSLRDYGNRVGVWRLMEVLSRYGVRASAATQQRGLRPPSRGDRGHAQAGLGAHGPQPDQRAAPERDGAGAGARGDPCRLRSPRQGDRQAPVGWLGAGLAETWNTLDYLSEAGIRYVCDWVERRPALHHGRRQAEQWCRCPTRCRPTTCPPIST